MKKLMLSVAVCMLVFGSSVSAFAQEPEKKQVPTEQTEPSKDEPKKEEPKKEEPKKEEPAKEESKEAAE